MLAIAVLFVVVALPLSGLFFLKTETGNRWLISWAAGRLEKDTGIAISVDRSRLGLIGGELTLYDVALRSTDASLPFATATQIDARFAWRKLFGHPRIFDRVHVDGFQVDPRYLPASASGGSDGKPLPLTIENLTWNAGTLGPWSGQGDVALWFEHGGFRALAGSGSLADGLFRIADGKGEIVAHHPQRPTITASAIYHGGVGLDGIVRDAALALESEALQLQVSMREGGGSAGQADWTLSADVGRLFPDLSERGSVDADGSLEWDGPQFATSGTAQVRRFPAALLAPFTQDRLQLDLFPGRWIEGNGRFDVVLGSGGGDRLEIDADMRLRDRDRVWLEAEVVSNPQRLRWSASLLPGVEEGIEIEGRLVVPSWERVDEGRLEATTLWASIADLKEASRQLGILDRGFELRPTGSLETSLQLEGPLSQLRLEGDLSWAQSEQPILQVKLESDDLSQRATVRGRLLPLAEGQREFRAQLTPGEGGDWEQPHVDEATARVLLPDPYGAGQQLADLFDVLRPHEPYPAWLEWLLAADPSLDGELSAVARVRGDLQHPEAIAHFVWQPDLNERLTLSVNGRFPLDDIESGEVAALDLRTEGLGVKHLIAVDPDTFEGLFLDGQIDLHLLASGPIRQPRALLSGSAKNLHIADIPPIENATFEMDADLERWRLRDLMVDWIEPRYGSMRASGEAQAQWPLQSIELDIQQQEIGRHIAAIDGRVRFNNGWIEIVESDWTAADGVVGQLSGSLPLIERWSGRALQSASGRGRLDLSDWEVGLLEEWITAEQPLTINGKLSGTIEPDLEQMADVISELRLNEFKLELGDDRLDAVDEVRFSSANRRFTLSPSKLLAVSNGLPETAPLKLQIDAQFDPQWQVEQSPLVAWSWMDVLVDGTLDASLLAPILDASGSGPVQLSLKAEGRPDNLSATATLSGQAARFLLSDPYPTRIEHLEMSLSADNESLKIDSATADFNGGLVELSAAFGWNGAIDLAARFKDVRYRLGYGVTTWIDANLELDWPQTGPRVLRGDAVVQRALLNRDLNLDREILRAIFDPELDTGTSRVLETVDLELNVLTDQGLIVRNNLAELRADWNRIDIGGTLADPRLSGVAQVVPGGRLHLLGETLRLDEASLRWDDAPPDAPVIEYEATSSREDPTIGQSWRAGWYTTDFGPGQGGALGFWGAASSTPESALGASLASYTQDRLYGSLANVLNRTELSYEPLPLFGEVDTQARFTLSQQISNQLSLIASTDPQQAEGQTYIVDLHDFRFAPSMRAQLFTGDNESAGVTLQQTITLGDDRDRLKGDPRVHRREIELPEGIAKKRIRRALGYRKGDPFSPGSELDVELDVAEAMRLNGYPDATVLVQTVPREQNQVDLEVAVEAGPRVRFVFAGPDEMRRETRLRLRGMYQSDEEEPRAFREMTHHAQRALRATGCLQPQVIVEAVSAEEGEQRRVRIGSACGRTVAIEDIVFIGVPVDVANWLQGGFRSVLSRVELAAAVVDADAHLRRSLETVGYPDVRIVSRRVSEDGRRLELRLEPGTRLRVDEITIEGADALDSEIVRGAMTIRAGDPLRRDWVDQSARRLERELRAEGYNQATVRREIVTESELARIIFRVDIGRQASLAQVKIEGLKHSNPGWVSDVAGLRVGELLDREKVTEARGRLYRTGVFDRIRVMATALDNPSEEAEPTPTAISFELDEAPRYQLSYGGRWDSDVGLGGVIDLVNRHSLGRGHRTGVRAILNSDLNSLRVYHRIPRPLPSERSSLLLFVEGKRETIEDVTSDVVEAWAQLTFPLSQRTQTRIYSVIGDRRIVRGVPTAEIPLEEQVISPRFGWQLAYTTVERSFTNQRRKGLFFGVDLSGSHASLGADLTSFGLFSQFNVYAPFGTVEHGRFSWHQAYRGGVLTARERKIPFVDRLRAGGEYSVRGYPTNSLGELDVDGTALGGELLFVMNQELHARLWESLSGVLFFDAGNVWNSPDQFEFDLFRSVGIGARYNSPVGPLRFDLGFPLDRRPSDADFQFYVGFGSVF